MRTPAAGIRHMNFAHQSLGARPSSCARTAHEMIVVGFRILALLRDRPASGKRAQYTFGLSGAFGTTTPFEDRNRAWTFSLGYGF